MSLYNLYCSEIHQTSPKPMILRFAEFSLQSLYKGIKLSVLESWEIYVKLYTYKIIHYLNKFKVNHLTEFQSGSTQLLYNTIGTVG